MKPSNRQMSFPFHPALLALYPILFLYGQNLHQVNLSAVPIPLAFSLLAALVIWSGLYAVSRDKDRSALATSHLLLLFFTYGHVCILAGQDVTQRSILPIWAIMLLTGQMLIWYPKWKIRITPVVNLLAGALILSALIQIGQSALFSHGIVSAPSTLPPLGPAESASVAAPDIYYIILDSYAGESTLQQLYHFDNSLFLGELEKRGFYVAHQSHSNYPFTFTSMPATFSMDYLDPAKLGVPIDSTNLAPMGRIINENAVFTFVRQHGYEVRIIGSPNRHGTQDFQGLLLNTTMWRTIAMEDEEHARTQILTDLEQVEKLPTLPEAKGRRFIYAHIYCPHAPFVFGPDGEPVSSLRFRLHMTGRKDIRKLYNDQVTYLNKRILQVIDSLQKNSRRPPIILLQADHGPVNLAPPTPVTPLRLQEAFPILNAYCLPGRKAPLYPTISPINSFRTVFNVYFDTKLPLLPDKSFYCTYGHPYQFQPVH